MNHSKTRPPRRYVKICGNLYPEESERVASFEPDIMGWIFSPSSPRMVTLDSAEEQIAGIRKRHPSILHAAVFSGNNSSEIMYISNRQKFDILQVADDIRVFEAMREFAGSDEEGNFQDLFLNTGADRREISQIPIAPVLRVRGKISDRDLREYGPAPFYILDSYDPNRPGGTGVRFDLSLIEGITLPFFLAGGLNDQNVKEALMRTGAIGADVSSGVEAGMPGRKDADKVRRFIEAVRSIGGEEA